ncbi:WS/DGAT domain-containing protein [Mycobacterium intracellulare]|uniref:WS/DGAT domain-containing protein n=1 Tax=Mycobacterium intracellulare TaxID=1767 RepID=UPI001EEEB340|nr:WS/DGAT domain-containing protein [Mycobacterium intracellulare]MEE3753602.1 WS/DGAT domain-containing protein [Mycobacterium intracellulare]
MTARRMAAVDAQFYWMSAKIPSDEFLLYAFDGAPTDLGRAVEQVRGRADACPGLSVRVHDRSVLRYPQWVSTRAVPEQIVCQELADRTWDGCLTAVATLADGQLDVRRMPWRLHVLTPVVGIPGVDGPGAVAVVQIAHALADGGRGAAMAAWLLGRDVPVPEARRLSAGFLPWRAVQAARGHRRQVRDIRAGLLTAGAGPRPLLATNARPDGARSVRTLVRPRAQLRGPTVTVGALAAVSTALHRLLGPGSESLGAEVPMAKPGVPHANNHFGNVVVGLYPQLDLDARLRRIAADLANGRRRFEHPATRAADRAFAAVPAPLLRWGINQFDLDQRPTQVAGNTVLSSVYRGAADLSFGGAPVVLTAGYPALSPMMGLTHGVHGIGDTIAISVHASASAVPDIDAYVALLEAAL